MSVRNWKTYENSTGTVTFPLKGTNGIIRVNSIAGTAIINKKDAGGTWREFFTVAAGVQKKEENCSSGEYKITTTGNFNYEYLD